ncbi:hypothetical protein PIB30_089624 [Stylosanthes scabra]|uniref:Uncharacterized protein n=1 Tax=Stylosanthes scabra TaxID=79078 RepID=A0ABU6VT69_9FABA|nr:hypothetical protein [Stylosanthes scabra]
METLDEMKNFILHTMGVVSRKYVRRIAYMLLDILPFLEYKFKLFWLEGDVHVRAMFNLHRRYGPRQVMKLLVKTHDVNSSEAGPSSSRACPVGPIAAPLLRIATPDMSMELDSGSDDGSDRKYVGETEESTDSFDEADHFHTLNLDDMEEEVRDGGRGNDYLNLDGREEFRVGH